MTKSEFLQLLSEKLSQLPAAEIERSVSYFSEIIDDRIEDGFSEEEAVAKLDSIDDISEQILCEMPITAIVKTKIKSSKKPSTLQLVLIILGIPFWLPVLIAVFSVIMSVYIVIWSVIISLFAVIFALVLSGIITIALSPFLFAQDPSYLLVQIGISLVCAGIGAVLFFPCVRLSSLLIKQTVSFSKFLKSYIIKSFI